MEREHEFQQRFPIEIFVQQETCQHFCHRIVVVSRFHGQYQQERGWYFKLFSILSKSVIFRETEVLMAKNQDEQILCIRKGKH